VISSSLGSDSLPSSFSTGPSSITQLLSLKAYSASGALVAGASSLPWILESMLAFKSLSVPGHLMVSTS